MKTKSLSFNSLLLASVFFISCCCSNKNQHKIKTFNNIGGEYEVEHRILGDCVSKNNHFIDPELSEAEALGIIASNNLVIDTMSKFSNRMVEKVAAPTNGYNAQGFVLDHGHSKISPKYIKDILRSTKYIDIKNCNDKIPEVEDIIIYELNNVVVHSGKVVSMELSNNPRITSKWETGPAYQHDWKNIPYDFNQRTYYRKELDCQVTD